MTQRWRGYLFFIRAGLRASKLLSALVMAGIVVDALAPVGAVAAIGVVVAQVPEVIAAGLDSPAGRTAVLWAVLAGGLFLLQSSAGAARGAAATALGERIDAALQRELMEAVMAPVGIAHLEDATSLDLISVGRETFRATWARPGRIVGTVSGLVSGRLMLLGTSLLVAHFQPVLALAVLAAALWAGYEDKAASRAEAGHHYRGTEASRRTEYYMELGVNPPAAKEIRVFGLSSFLLDRFMASWNRSMVDVLAPPSRRPLGATATLAAVIILGTAWIARAAVDGQIGPGPAAVYVQALMVSLSAMSQLSWSGLQTELALATLERYQDAAAAVESAEASQAPRGARQATGLPLQGIRFENVSFTYPGSRVDAVRGLDLEVKAGTSLAIVGANGAGKTTLIKLLCRLYEPTQGRITADGIDLGDLDARSWRRQLAAVFQDAVHFELPAAENIALGRVEARADHAGVKAAAGAAGVATVIEGLPRGWDTPLSSEYAGGADLSGGEWQKVGLARALFAVRNGASVLILDEPAAHLDARAEAQLYAQFLALTEGVTTVVISHRFSTVRQASSIVVVDEGRVVEQGRHSELLARDGAYAEMFRLQAARFADAGTVGVEKGAAAE